MKLTSVHSQVVDAFHCNDIDSTMNNGHGVANLFHLEQRYKHLRRTLWGEMWSICRQYGFRATWSRGPMCVRAGDAALAKWTSSAARPGGKGLARSDIVREECHRVGIIATPRGVAEQIRARTVKGLGRQGGMAAWLGLEPRTLFPNKRDAWLNNHIDSARPNAVARRAWDEWRATCCNDEWVRPEFLVPMAGNFVDYVGDPNIPLRHEPLTFVVVPTTKFVTPPRGEYCGSGALICTDAELLIPFRTTSAQSVHHTCAIGVLLALSITHEEQEATISTPLEYVEHRIRGWRTFSEAKKATTRSRNTLQVISDLMLDRPWVRIVTTPTDEVAGRLDPAIDNELLNQRPGWRWTGEGGGLARQLAAEVTQEAPELPRIVPPETDPLRLLFMNTALSENREGRLSHFIHQDHDNRQDRLLQGHPLLGAYFGPGVHPCTWSALLHHTARSWFVNARGMNLPIGQNLVIWGFHDPEEREVRCVCNWEAACVEFETLSHILLECERYAETAQALRQPLATLQEALGRVEEALPGARAATPLQEAKERQQALMDATLATWKERSSLRKRALAESRDL